MPPNPYSLNAHEVIPRGPFGWVNARDDPARVRGHRRLVCRESAIRWTLIGHTSPPSWWGEGTSKRLSTVNGHGRDTVSHQDDAFRMAVAVSKLVFPVD